MLIETHAHFCDAQFDSDREAAIERAKIAGVQMIVEIADHPQGWDDARKLSEKFSDGKDPQIFWTCGFHPHHAGEQEGFDFDIMVKTAALSKCVAIGEIGLDYVKSTASKEDQISLFRKSLEAAASAQKPVVIHCREAQADTLRILRSFFGGLSRRELCMGVIHCFSGDLNFAEGCLDLGFYLGVDGPVTYPSAKNLREVISHVPLDRIVLETDSPYLPPQAFRGKRNESSYLVHIAQEIARIFNKDVGEIESVTTENAKRLFRI